MTKGKGFAIIGISLLALIGLFLNSGLVPYYLEEPRRVMIAIEMMFNNNYIVATELGNPYYKKPPVFNWILIGFYKLFGGESEWVSRAAVSLLYVLWPILQFQLLKNWISKKAAFLASVFLFISVEFILYASLIAEIDIFYAMISSLSMLGFIIYIKDKPNLAFSLLYGLNAIGLLTKGLPSLLFIGFSLFLWAVYFKNIKLLLNKAHALGILIFLVIAGGYFLAYSQFNSPMQFISDFWDQSEKRTILQDKNWKLLKHISLFPVWFWFSMAPASLLIFSLFRLKKSERKSWWNKTEVKLLFFFLLGHFAVYWISPGSHMRYVYMLYPFAIIPMAVMFTEHLKLPFNQQGWAFADAKKSTTGILLISIPIAFFLIGFWLTPMFGYERTSSLNSWMFFSVLIIASSYVVYKQLGFAWHLLACFLILRIVLNFYVLPIRATEGAIAQNYRNALTIHEITKDKELYVWHKLTANTFSLSTGWYLGKERGEPLVFTNQTPEEGYLITEPPFLEDHPNAKILYQFKNGSVTFLLIDP